MSNQPSPKRLAFLGRYLTVWMLVCMVVGCPSKKQPQQVLQGKIVIKGSNTFGEELARALIAEYQKEQPQVTFELESKGSASGFAALLAGECDIAAASRATNEDELRQARSRRMEFNEYFIGSYGVAVIVNAANPVKNLTSEQVRDIFTGLTSNWKLVGGADAPIHLCIRDPISGTYLGFRELAMENKPYFSGAQMFTNYSGIVQTVVQDANAIGYSSMGLAEKSGVKCLSIGGTPPTVLSVNEYHYPYARSLRLYTDKARESTAARDFVRFVQSKRGQTILEQMGFVRRFEPWLPADYD